MRKKKPVSSVLIPRTAFFDPYKSRTRRKKLYTYSFTYADKEIEIVRPENTIVHEKIFYSIIKLSTRYDLYYSTQTKWSNLFVADFYQLKKHSGLNRHTSFLQFMEYVRDLSQISVSIKKDRKTVLYINSLIGSARLIREVERNGFPSYEVAFQIDDEVLALIEHSTKFSISRKMLKEVNSIKSPYTYKLIMFFATQTKPQTHRLFILLENITGKTFSKYQRSRIRKEVFENKHVFSKYNISIEEPEIVRLIKPFGKVWK